MRLYLSSYMWGNEPNKFIDLLGDGAKNVALITNAADMFPEDGVVERMRLDMDFLQSYGLASERLDLRDFFHAEPNMLIDKLSHFGMIWVRGANVFVLRRAMRQSGFDSVITELLESDDIVYGGFSAGACVMGSTLHGLELVDDANIVPEKYDLKIIWDGLGLLPYAIAPHFKSDHPESADIDKAVTYYQQNHIAYKGLRDGQAIYVNGDLNEIIG